MTQAPPQDRAHFLAWEALPWVVNGQANADQQDAVARHLPHCTDCQAELQYQQQLQQAMAQDLAGLPDGEGGLHRLLTRIELDALCDQPSPTQATSPAQPSQRRPKWWGSAWAAAVLLPVLGWGVGVTSWKQDDQPTKPSARRRQRPPPGAFGSCPIPA